MRNQLLLNTEKHWKFCRIFWYWCNKTSGFFSVFNYFKLYVFQNICNSWSTLISILKFREGADNTRKHISPLISVFICLLLCLLDLLSSICSDQSHFLTKLTISFQNLFQSKGNFLFYSALSCQFIFYAQAIFDALVSLKKSWILLRLITFHLCYDTCNFWRNNK